MQAARDEYLSMTLAIIGDCYDTASVERESFIQHGGDQLNPSHLMLPSERRARWPDRRSTELNGCREVRKRKRRENVPLS